MAIPLELMTGGVSLIVGMVGQLMANNQKMKREQNADMISALGAQTKARNAAHKRSIGNTGFAWTRRIIALTVVFAVLVLPKLAALFYPEIAINVGYTEVTGGLFTWIFGGDETIVWKTASGLTITPLDTHTVASIIGLYFGSSTTKI